MLRRRTGLPHRVIVDKAHYFLDGARAGELLDLQSNGYTLVTYRASHLPKAVLKASEVILVTCESDPTEVAALQRLCRSTEPVESWRSVLGGLALGEAARAFIFTARNASNGVRATTLREFAVALDTLVPDVLEGHARRGDFSRWLRDVFGDYQLALEVGAFEERSRLERDPTAVAAIASAIRGRYDLTADDDLPCGGAGK